MQTEPTNKITNEQKYKALGKNISDYETLAWKIDTPYYNDGY